jgi:hypothetical protein
LYSVITVAKKGRAFYFQKWLFPIVVIDVITKKISIRIFLPRHTYKSAQRCAQREVWGLSCGPGSICALASMYGVIIILFWCRMSCSQATYASSVNYRFLRWRRRTTPFTCNTSKEGHFPSWLFSITQNSRYVLFSSCCKNAQCCVPGKNVLCVECAGLALCYCLIVHHNVC